ncbi:hypothetical protein DESA109040_22640 [Deinococcus saxicola]|uniref:hypothetical protein n=1 Tax=Deinococcus saxicola TaxID=249406 RepID=UPI0039F0EF07
MLLPPRRPAAAHPAARDAGFSLIWALILGAVLMLTAASIVQSASAAERAAGSVTRGALASISERNVLSYGARLLAANAGVLMRDLNPASDAPGLARAVQGEVGAFSNP